MLHASLAPAPKAAPGCNRVITANETLRRITRFAGRLGVTRLADLTGLDRIGIPVYASVVPRSDDALSVYNGKGATRADAKAGALMEAIERQTVLNARLPVVMGSYEEIARSSKAVDPAAVCHELRPGYRPDRPIEWVEGRDLLGGDTIFVPAKLAGYMWRHLRKPSPYTHSGSHGLAAGNCLTEAVAHALCEWIERDAWTLAELESHWLPWARTEVAQGIEAARNGWDNLDSYPCLDLTGIPNPAARMLRCFQWAGLEPIVRDITSGLGIPTVLAASAEDNVPGFPQAHFGLGTHPDIRVAVVRALSELAQSRCVDIQGVREDITAAGVHAQGMAVHTRRVASIERRSWIHARSRASRPWNRVQSCWNDDILDDIRLMLARISAAGIPQAAMVDFSFPDEGIYVVRLIIPGLECWAIDRGRVGQRATNFWKSLVA